MKRISRYTLSTGRIPFEDWLRNLDPGIQARIDAYIVRLSLGAARKNVKPVGEGVFELKIDLGPGFRVYFAEIDRALILLLLGGHKNSQSKDIEKAKGYWRSFNAEN